LTAGLIHCSFRRCSRLTGAVVPAVGTVTALNNGALGAYDRGLAFSGVGTLRRGDVLAVAHVAICANTRPAAPSPVHLARSAPIDRPSHSPLFIACAMGRVCRGACRPARHAMAKARCTYRVSRHAATRPDVSRRAPTPPDLTRSALSDPPSRSPLSSKLERACRGASEKAESPFPTNRLPHFRTKPKPRKPEKILSFFASVLAYTLIIFPNGRRISPNNHARSMH
jgi:hypothetical protein